MNCINFRLSQDIHSHSIDFWSHEGLANMCDIGTLSNIVVKTQDERNNGILDNIITNLQVYTSHRLMNMQPLPPLPPYNSLRCVAIFSEL